MRSAARSFAAIALASLASGCVDEVDPPWQLDHTRIVAVRATPPGIVAGERAELDALLSFEGAPVAVRLPELATAVQPMSLASAVTMQDGKWVVTMPDEAQLAAARAELQLEADAPVPLVVGVAYEGQTLFATKVVTLGESLANPSVDSALVEGTAMRDLPELVIDAAIDTRFEIEATPDDDIDWFSSVGTLYDFDLREAFVRIEAEDPLVGEFAVVKRDDRGGVAWRVWPMRAE